MILLGPDTIQIKKTANKGRGMFTKTDLKGGTIIGDYIGKVVRTRDSVTNEDDIGLYLMYYHDQASIYPNDLKGNGMHLINHSCTPNSWMYTYQGHTLFFTLRHIFPGEELTVSYLLSPDPYCDPCPHICNCKSPYCTGTMHLSTEKYQQWSRFRAIQATQTKRARIRYNQTLPILNSYPETIPDDPIYPLFGSFDKPSIQMNTKLESVQKLRKLIRETGQSIEFSKSNIRVLGALDGQIISQPL